MTYGHLPMASSSSSPCGSSGTGAVGSTTPAQPGDKIITYLRHGKSAGNAGVMGVMEMGSLTAYRDGVLVSEGELQVVERVASVDEELMRRIVEAEVVLVSPLARAMATAVIVLAQAHLRSFQANGRTQRSWPRVEVLAELREKVKSCSERPGSGEDPLAYVRAVAEKYGESAYGNAGAMQCVVEDIWRSYNQERAATNGWAWEPEDAVSYHCMIRRFRERLSRRPETNVLVVGHSGWARFAFAALLPAAVEEDEDRRRLNLVTGSREVRALNNAGVLVARFSSVDCSFQDLRFRGGGRWLPNFEREDTLGILGSPSEALAAGVLPKGADFERIILLKLAEYMSSWEVRLFTFSSAGGEAHLCWASKWGAPAKHIAIGGDRVKLTRLTEDTFVVAETAGHRPFKVRGRTLEDATRFAELFTLYRQRGTPEANG